jgi:hypothetical protein
MSRRGKGEEDTDYGVHALQSGNKAGKGGVVDYSHIRPEAGERGLGLRERTMTVWDVLRRWRNIWLPTEPAPAMATTTIGYD